MNLTVRCIAGKKVKLLFLVHLISLAVHSVNVPVHLTTTIPVRPNAFRKEKFTLKEPETDMGVTFVSVAASIGIATQNVLI